MARLGQFSTYLRDVCELKAINTEIIRIRGNSDITVTFLQMSIRCSAYVSVKLVLMEPNSLASVLGFKQSIAYGDGRHSSETPVNII